MNLRVKNKEPRIKTSQPPGFDYKLSVEDSSWFLILKVLVLKLFPMTPLTYLR